MPHIDSWGQNYIGLAFRIHQHVEGYVDAYSGPPALRDAVVAAPPVPPNMLVSEAEHLLEALADCEYPTRRRTYLEKQVTAMITTCRQLAGEQLSYREEIRRCFDIDPQPIAETEFDAAIEDLQTLLPGQGSVHERMIAWRKQFEVSPTVAQSMLEVIEPELRRRTVALYPLPADEAVEFRLVNDQPWSGYNWYYGNYRSGVDLNTDLPIQANSLTYLIAHEAYPGHHTEHCIKEAGLFNTRGWAEHSIMLINTPECVLSEGIADTGQQVIFAPGELEQWQATHVYPLGKLNGDPERERRLGVASRALSGVGGNAALLLHDEGRSAEDVIKYLMRYSLSTEQQARQRLRFLSNPLWRSYVFTYFYGARMIRAWLAQGEPVARFGTLLNEQIYPSLLERWAAGE